jgi:hypothetical protein
MKILAAEKNNEKSTGKEIDWLFYFYARKSLFLGCSLEKFPKHVSESEH